MKVDKHQVEDSAVVKTSYTQVMLPVACSCLPSPLPVAILGCPAWTEEEPNDCFKTFLSSNSFHFSSLSSAPPQTCSAFLDLGLCPHFIYKIKLVPNLTCLSYFMASSAPPCFKFSTKGSGDHLGRFHKLNL